MVENDEEIKKSIEEEIKKPSKKDIRNPTVILLNGDEESSFFKNVDSFITSINKLFKIFSDLKKNNIEEKIIKNFEDEINGIIKSIEIIKKSMKLNINDFEELNNASKEFDKEITDYNSNLSNYFDKYKGGVSDFLKEYFTIKESNIFNLDFSLTNIPKNPTESNIDLSKMNKDSENLCVFL